VKAAADPASPRGRLELVEGNKPSLEIADWMLDVESYHAPPLIVIGQARS
jgi:hypothetical protein